MPIKIKTDLEFGQPIYIKADPEQLEHRLIGVVITPPMQIKFRVSYMGDVSELYDFECSTERDELKFMENKPGDDD